MAGVNRLALVALLCAAKLASAQDAGASSVPGGLRMLRAKSELRWGADAQGGAPFVFQDPMDPNMLVGFEVDLSVELANKLGVKPRPVHGQWEQLLDLLARGDFDIAMNGIEVTGEKERVALLTRPCYVSPEKLTVRKNDPKAPR